MMVAAVGFFVLGTSDFRILKVVWKVEWGSRFEFWIPHSNLDSPIIPIKRGEGLNGSRDGVNLLHETSKKKDEREAGTPTENEISMIVS